MLARTAPNGPHGNHREHREDHGRERERRQAEEELVGGARRRVFLRHQLQRVGDGLEETEHSDPVGAGALREAPQQLALHQDDVGHTKRRDVHHKQAPDDAQDNVDQRIGPAAGNGAAHRPAQAVAHPRQEVDAPLLPQGHVGPETIGLAPGREVFH